MAGELVARSARAVAAVLRPAMTRWRAFWDVDHRAPNFHSDEEWAAVQEKLSEDRKAALKAEAVGHFKQEVLPRMALDISRGVGGLQLNRPAAEYEGDIWHLYEKCARAGARGIGVGWAPRCSWAGSLGWPPPWSSGRARWLRAPAAAEPLPHC